ncbi:hypothetical protein ACO9S2_10135 [Nitrospira sp. NS4]|uniref:hypothetical protein n=1 Tax=Nitrospira sp. NS4 TaxID=3414498 RepID=UPI003C30A493
MEIPMFNSQPPANELNANRTDMLIALSKGTLNSIPYIGGLVAEVIGTIIPNQRIDRIAGMLQALEQKVTELDKTLVSKRFTDPGFVDLFEESMYQAARSISRDRLEHIAALIKNGLAESDEKAIQYKKLISLLSALNDTEIIILRSHAKHPKRDAEFWDRHKKVLEPRLATHGSPQEVLDEVAIYESYTQHLVGLGLLCNSFELFRQGEIPEFDKRTGMPKASGQDITNLGRLLLRSIDLIKQDDY